jgi:hypothetical protein
MTPTIRYPANPVTPHGAYHILRDRIPQMSLTAYDESIVLHLMGGLAIHDPTTPERVELKSIDGLVPPWTTIDQKGATEDGVSFIDALYDPIETTATVVAHGRNPAYCRKVINHTMASIDVKRVARLSWFTHEMGYWWANVRWFKPPTIATTTKRRQQLDLRLRADTGFWESFPNVEQFRFDYTATGDDDFETDNPAGLNGSLWSVHYSSGGSGNLFVNGGEVKSTLSNRTAVARRTGYTSPDDNQVVEVEVGRIQQWFYPTDAAIDVWARMPSSGTVGNDGVRLRIERHALTVSSFHSGTETVLRKRVLPLIIPPLTSEKFTFIAGRPAGALVPAQPRAFAVLRNGAPVMSFIETGTTSQIGSGFRNVGFGLSTSSSTLPPGVSNFTAGRNATEKQSGFIRRINAGDQEAWDRYTCVGPGIFRFGNGPGSTELVEFGPLLPGQIAQIRTDPRKYGVKDLTPASTPIAPSLYNAFTKALQDLLSFMTSRNSVTLSDVFATVNSLVGGSPAPQGNLYPLLHGRFSNPIPAKSPGNPAQVYHIMVEIEDGNAESAIIASLTPLRRYPY